ncbi:MAG: response regulator [Desulfobacterales bacterium]|nr:MAG: response regulator [Desulfobacterales bacterium]
MIVIDSKEQPNPLPRSIQKVDSGSAPHSLKSLKNQAMRPVDLNIFIVDDDESILRSVRRLLLSSGYIKIATFESAEDFLRDAVLECPCLLILDLLLPGMSGVALHRHLQEADHFVDTVFISAREQELEKARTKCPEAIAFLQKPFEKVALLAAVRSVSGADT